MGEDARAESNRNDGGRAESATPRVTDYFRFVPMPGRLRSISASQAANASQFSELGQLDRRGFPFPPHPLGEDPNNRAVGTARFYQLPVAHSQGTRVGQFRRSSSVVSFCWKNTFPSRFISSPNRVAGDCVVSTVVLRNTQGSAAESSSLAFGTFACGRAIVHWRRDERWRSPRSLGSDTAADARRGYRRRSAGHPQSGCLRSI